MINLYVGLILSQVTRSMLDALDEYMPESVKFRDTGRTLFVWCTLPDSIELDKVGVSACGARAY